MRFFKLTGLTFLAGALALPIGTAVAQQAEEQMEEAALEEIITTGSRIARKDLTGAAAVTVISEQDIQLTGNVSIGDILQDLTTNSNGINVQANNGGSGATRVNLRGLGSARTLVLVNGRRMVGTAGSSSVDLNAIPTAAIERVEVLKDGASAVYGSDAVAGVVNIITRTDFDGVELGTYYGNSDESDGAIKDISLTIGMSGERGNMLISAGYYDQDDIFAGDRDYSFFDKTYDWTLNDGTFREDGSTAPPEGFIIDRSGDAGNQAWQDVINGPCPSTDCFNDPSAGWRDFNGAGTSDVGTGDRYNYQPINYLLTPQTRFNIYAAGRYELTPAVSAFIETSYLDRQSDQLLAPTPLFTISEGISATADNFYNPFGRDFSDVRRRFLEAGGRNSLQDIDTFRGVAGLQGDLPVGENWAWEGYFNYGRTNGTTTGKGRFIRSRVINAIGPSYVDTDGVPQCGTDAANQVAGCVPLDLFGGAAVRPIAQDQLDYISYTGVDDQLQTQRTWALNFSGDAFDMPAGPMGVAFGFEKRYERGYYTNDPITASGDTTGNKAENTAGSYDVTEAYVEFLVPIFEGFNASIAARYSDYSNFGDDTNGKFGLTWDVFETGLTLRGTISEAFRAPTINNLFAGNSDSFPASTDPCDTTDEPRTANEQANCSADGLPDNYQDNRTQLKTRVGGNPDLQPETADTWTVGLVYQPNWLEGFAVTADWWDIEVDDSIQGIGANVILAQCYNVPPAERSLCEKVERDGTGFLQNVDNRTANVGGANTAGLDMTMTYDHETSFGDFRYNLDIAYLDQYEEIQADGSTVDGLGYYDLGVYAEWKWNLNVNYRREAWSANLTTRYIDEFQECQSNDCTSLYDDIAGNENPVRDVEDNWQHDLQVSYDLDWNDMGAGTISFGIQNLTDEDPAVIFNGFLATSDSDTYDFLGRYYYLSYRHTL